MNDANEISVHRSYFALSLGTFASVTVLRSLVGTKTSAAQNSDDDLLRYGLPPLASPPLSNLTDPST